MTLQPMSVFITGANRGIGLAFVKSLMKLPNPPRYVIGSYRNSENSQDLLELSAQNSNVYAIRYDVRDYLSLPKLVEEVDMITGGAGVNLLINNAGAGFQKDNNNLSDVTPENMREAFEINTTAPLILTNAFLPLLKKAAGASNEAGLSCTKAAVINLASIMGTWSDDRPGGNYPYRSSKAAFHMVTRNLSADLMSSGILVAGIHPGWVQTDMGGPKALITASHCVQALLDVMAAFTDKDTGTIVDNQGKGL